MKIKRQLLRTKYFDSELPLKLKLTC